MDRPFATIRIIKGGVIDLYLKLTQGGAEELIIRKIEDTQDALEFFESFTLLSEDEKTQEIIEKGQAEACPCLLKKYL